jgi:hypothetical protein
MICRMIMMSLEYIRNMMRDTEAERAEK